MSLPVNDSERSFSVSGLSGEAGLSAKRSERYALYLAPMEDVNADALVRDVASTMRKLTISDAERPVSIQIYGREPESMADAARIVEQAHPDFIDINFGCPVKKVAGKGAGAGLLRDVPKMLEIARAVVNAVHIPVTAKTRLGWDENSLYLPDGTPFIVDLAERLQDAGVSELAIHGRTRSQMYRGEADWTLIGEVKNNPRIHIPIIGNGDVCTPERARECFDKYGVDAIMIGRATFGAPWLFAEMKEFLNGRDLEITGSRDHEKIIIPRSMKDKVAVLKEHVLASIQWCGNDEHKGILHSRRHFAASPVFKGLTDFKQTRIALLRADTKDEVFAIMDEIVAKWGNPS